MPEVARGMSGYEKRLMDESGTTYEIWECYADGRKHKVKEDQDIYQKWVLEGNEPTVIPYTPPQPIPYDVKRLGAYCAQIKPHEMFEAMYEKLEEGRPGKWDAIQVKRLAIKAQFPKPG